MLITRPATPTDVPGLTVLINRAYRGRAARGGWTTEAHLFHGPRITEDALRELFRAPYTRLWCCHEPAQGLVGCICLTRPPGDTLTISLLAVAPEAQAHGVGRQLLLHAEQQAQHLRCSHLEMSVLVERPDLLAWYARRGYSPTGAAEPFGTNSQFGHPRQLLYLLTLEKVVSPA
ncbi:MAG: GNAT family N-acetyltransferase [Janthinobacterium lividum]